MKDTLDTTANVAVSVARERQSAGVGAMVRTQSKPTSRTLRAVPRLLLVLCLVPIGCGGGSGGGDDEPGGSGSGGVRAGAGGVQEDAAVPRTDASAHAGASGGGGASGMHGDAGTPIDAATAGIDAATARDAGVDAAIARDAGPRDAGLDANADDAGAGCTPTQCALLDTACTHGTCNAATGLCELQLVTPGTSCGDTTSDQCTLPDSCDAFGQCVANHKAATTACGDTGQPCMFDDHCDGAGRCVDSGPKPNTAVCGSTAITPCHPVADLCDGAGVCVVGTTTDGTACGDTSDTDCRDPDTCQAGQCVTHFSAADTACGSEDEAECDHADRCDGLGTCLSRVEGLGFPCGLQSSSCTLASFCSGTGQCLQGGNVTAGTACGDTGVSACDGPDSCDDSGVCATNYAPSGTDCDTQSAACMVSDTCNGMGTCIDGPPRPEGTLCGNVSETGCDAADSCDAGGTCIPNYAPLGAACGDQNATCLQDDGCDGTGSCVDNGIAVGCLWTAHGTVEAQGAPLAGVTVDVVDIPTVAADVSDGSGAITLSVPVGTPLLLHAAALATYWGRIDERLVTPYSADLSISVIADSEISAATAGIGGLGPLDTGLGMVLVMVDGAQGGETIAIDVVSEPPIAMDASGTFVLAPSSAIPMGAEPFLLFTNVVLGNVNATVSNSNGSCTASYPTLDLHPVMAHTMTQLLFVCP